MRVVLCGSILFPEKMIETAERLRKSGHEVVVPYSIIKYNLRKRADAEALRSRPEHIGAVKPEFTKRHFREIENSDAILVVNIDKNGISNYIGGATFAEIMLAFHYGKMIFFLNPIPSDKRLDFMRDELECVQPTVINGDLGLLK